MTEEMWYACKRGQGRRMEWKQRRRKKDEREEKWVGWGGEGGGVREKRGGEGEKKVRGGGKGKREK